MSGLSGGTGSLPDIGRSVTGGRDFNLSSLDKAAFAVQAVFLFTLLAGLAVLWAAVSATRDEREFESAMLRSMGASRRRVLTGVATEFIAIGLLAGVLATAGATFGLLLALGTVGIVYTFKDRHRNWVLYVALLAPALTLMANWGNITIQKRT
mgnify:CR=1 FL=1